MRALFTSEVTRLIFHSMKEDQITDEKTESRQGDIIRPGGWLIFAYSSVLFSACLVTGLGKWISFN